MGTPLTSTRAPRRVVSLVPSLTEVVAVTAPELLVGATKYCTHPADLDVARVGGSKYPSVDEILALRPDLVLANAEENRREDAQALRAAGVNVWVTFPRTVAGALDSLGRMFDALRVPRPAWLAEARRVWAAPPATSRGRHVTVVWRRPWVTVGPDTFASDMLRLLGWVNVFTDPGQRYPRPTLAEIRALQPDLVVLPDEPYAFRADDGPESFPGVPCALVSGRHLTWYGPSLVEARAILERQLSSAAAA
ncbi:MAG: cobalamin-binding protein [Micromonosporaceae bacterium]|nr:cobalamin-binding protein [Micromonosporaceae bacterium]